MGSRRLRPIQRDEGGGSPGVVVYADEAALVYSQYPDTTFEYNTNTWHRVQESMTPGIGQTTIELVTKFETPVVHADWIAKDYPFILSRVGDIRGGSSGGIKLYATSAAPDNVTSFSVSIVDTWIEEDFDCSAITWNVLSGLTTSQATTEVIAGGELDSHFPTGFDTVEWWPAQEVMPITLTDGKTYYGHALSLSLTLVYSGGTPNYSAYVDIDVNELETKPDGWIWGLLI